MPLIELTDITYYSQPLPPDLAAVGKGILERWGLRKKTPDAPPPHLPKPLLNKVNLNIRPRETMVLLGPSGSGKSTLLKIIAGLLIPHSGTITYNGIPVQQVPIRERRIGMVFQEQALYQNMTGEDNIGFYYHIRHQEDQIPQRIRDVSRWMQVDLDPLLSRKPPTLSGGENQRIAIARALARDADIYLFDEPLGNLDARLRSHLRIALRRIFTTHPVTTVYVTHDLTEAATLGDRIAVMREGQIVQVGSAAEILYHPHDMFVADFFGGCNFLAGTIREDGCWSSGILSLEAPPIRIPAGKKITLGFRPSNIEIDPQGIFEVQVLDRIPMYERHLLHIEGRIEGVHVILEVPIEAEIGETFRISLTRTYWFETQTGLRLRY
jgi:ABC-type sugar transport system ATPase subunit